jgi:hypothetical protein
MSEMTATCASATLSLVPTRSRAERGRKTVKLQSRTRYRSNPVVERRRALAVQWVALVALVALTGYLITRALQAA